MSIQIANKYDPTQPYHTYYNIDMVNNDTTGTKQLPILRFDEIRNSPYLNSPENYFLSVVRFSIQTPTLPIFVPQAQLGQPDPDKLIYTFSMSFNVGPNTLTYQQNIEYQSFDLSQKVANPPLTVQDLSTQYYYILSYQQWTKMVNDALTACYNGLQALVLGAGGVMPTPNPPFFEFDPQNLLYILNADEAGYSASLVNPIKLFCNSPCQTLFSSFQFLKFGDTGVSQGKNYQFQIYNINDTNQLILPTYTALQMYQEGSTAGLLNPVQSIVFSTSLLPVVPENISVPKVWNADSNLFNVGNNANISPILTDFQVPFSPGNTYKPTIDYQPSGEYRLVDLYSNSPLSALELSVYWKDNFGNLHPFYLGAGCSANMKIMFRRKDFNATSLFKSI